VATKKLLVNRWLEEPGRATASRIQQIMLDYAEVLRPLERKAYEETGLYLIPHEWLPPFDTKSIFDLLEQLPFRDEVANGRDLRGIPSIGGGQGWDFSNTDFSFLPGTAGYGFSECNLDGAIFDNGKGEFNFTRGVLHKVRFRKVHYKRGVFFGCDCLECDFAGAYMKKAHFLANADLRGSSFAKANLSWASLANCDLRGCDFRGATLSGAAIQESTIDKTTDFRGANLVGLSWQDRRDNNGNLFKHGSDWRKGTYDSTTMHD
jgi:uncharacterized protein YjbI with pentapeptide repeats